MFLTKEQRAAEALKRRQEEVDKVRKLQDAERRIHDDIQKSRIEDARREDKEHR